MRITITNPSWPGPRTGDARPAFSRNRYHVRVDGDPRDLAFEAHELRDVYGEPLASLADQRRHGLRQQGGR